MPTYEYECHACGHKFEKFQSITAAPVKKCPQCGKSKAKRLIGTGAGIIFRGSGFYCTDYRSDSYRTAAKNDKPSPAAGDPASKPAGDSKPSSADKSKPAADKPKKSLKG